MRSSVKYHLGTVLWFDDKTGRGIITSSDGTNYKVHYSAIESKTKNKWKTLTENAQVKFVALDDPDYFLVQKVIEAE